MLRLIGVCDVLIKVWSAWEAEANKLQILKFYIKKNQISRHLFLFFAVE